MLVRAGPPLYRKDDSSQRRASNRSVLTDMTVRTLGSHLAYRSSVEPLMVICIVWKRRYRRDNAAFSGVWAVRNVH